MEQAKLDTCAMDRNYNLDLIKIVACIAVIGLHTFSKDISTATEIFYYLSGHAVPLFIMCSGYLISTKEHCSISYIANKIVSVLRIVVLWTAIFYCSQFVHQLITYQPFPKNLMHDMFLNILGSLLQKGIAWHFWYFGALIILYILHTLINRIKPHKIRIVILICVSLMAMSLQHLSYQKGLPIQSQVIQTLRIWTWLMYFELGKFIYRKEQKIAHKTKGCIAILATVVSICYQCT